MSFNDDMQGENNKVDDDGLSSNDENDSLESLSGSFQQLSTGLEKKSIPPITFLQEICSRNGFTYERQLLSTEGSVHEPTFKIAVTVDNITVTASGQSKKKAKHAAAREAIERLRQRKDLNFEGINFDHLTDSSSKINLTSRNGANPVGKLQEFCMKMRVNPPDYDTWDEKGLAHERVFKISCKISSLNLITFGQGRSKKLAKRRAAEIMLEKLIELDIYEKSTHKSEEVEKKSLLIDNGDPTSYIKSKENLKNALSKTGWKVSDLVTDLTMIFEDDIQDGYYYEACMELADQVGSCKFEYLSDQHCLLTIFDKSDNPVITSFGFGDGNVESMRNSVINAYKQIIVLLDPSISTSSIPSDPQAIKK